MAKIAMQAKVGPFARRTVLIALGCFAGANSACGPGQKPAAPVVAEDGLATAYGIFRRLFVQAAQDRTYTIGFGYQAGLCTSKIVVDQVPVNGQATIDFGAGTVTAHLLGPEATGFDLYFVKNATDRGSARPESFDRFFEVGTFAADPSTPNRQTLSVSVGTAPFPRDGVNFDLDMVVVSLHGQSPATSVVATGARTLFEKRFFRERAGQSQAPVAGVLADFVETGDPLVRRGGQLFAFEAFGGNGRTCATCHPPANNQKIDPAFVQSLPPGDPLFQAPAGFEDPALLTHALVRENVDGLEDPVHKFVERAVPSTLSMNTSIGEVGTGLGQSNLFDGSSTMGVPLGDGPPPDQRLGWGGDGAPGRGTLQEFAFGAIVQHLSASLARVPDRDYRTPTQAELDALEAYLLFNGRQTSADTRAIVLADPAAEAGRGTALGAGQCSTCHVELLGVTNQNFSVDTGVEQIPISFRTPANMPVDGGFGPQGSIATGFGNGDFNVPSLYEAADTPPYFHNGAVATLEDAVAFYNTSTFDTVSGAAFAAPSLSAQDVESVGAFLRTINALVNIAQVRRRAEFLRDHTTPGGAEIVSLAIHDTEDAVRVLSVPALGGAGTADALAALREALGLLQSVGALAAMQPATKMDPVLALLDRAKGALLARNPNADF
jgi:cytochrome c peroxidase